MHLLKGGPMRRLSQKLRRGAILIYPMGGDDTAFRIRVTVLPDTFAVSSLSVYRIFTKLSNRFVGATPKAKGRWRPQIRG